MALEQQHINSTQLLHVTVLFEFLTDLGTDSGDGHTQGVHGLDFGGLSSSSVCYLFIHLPSFRSVSIRPTKRDKLTALNHSLYDLRTRYLASLQLAAKRFTVVCVSSLCPPFRACPLTLKQFVTTGNGDKETYTSACAEQDKSG